MSAPGRDPIKAALAEAARHPHKGPNDTDASMLLAAAKRLRAGHEPGGSWTKQTVARVCEAVAALIEDGDDAPRCPACEWVETTTFADPVAVYELARPCADHQATPWPIHAAAYALWLHTNPNLDVQAATRWWADHPEVQQQFEQHVRVVMAALDAVTDNEKEQA